MVGQKDRSAEGQEKEKGRKKAKKGRRAEGQKVGRATPAPLPSCPAVLNDQKEESASPAAAVPVPGVIGEPCARSARSSALMKSRIS
jgi:hypothetical protein